MKIMLKKSKRTLSLLLALIMICSAMGVMAFAAETGGDGHEYYFTGTGTFPMSFDYGSSRITGTATVQFTGIWNDTERTASWNLCTLSITGSYANNFEWARDYARENQFQKIFKVYYSRNNADPVLVYEVKVLLSERRTIEVSYSAVVNGDTTLWHPATVSYTFED